MIIYITVEKNDLDDLMQYLKICMKKITKIKSILYRNIYLWILAMNRNWSMKTKWKKIMQTLTQCRLNRYTSEFIFGKGSVD